MYDMMIYIHIIKHATLASFTSFSRETPPPPTLCHVYADFGRRHVAAVSLCLPSPRDARKRCATFAQQCFILARITARHTMSHACAEHAVALAAAVRESAVQERRSRRVRRSAHDARYATHASRRHALVTRICRVFEECRYRLPLPYDCLID